MARSKKSRVALSLLAGFVFCFLALELTLRLVGSFSVSDAPATGPSGGPVMLFAGNSHTLGVHTTQGNCYPEKLGKLLPEWRIVNGAELNMNSAQVLRKLPGLLARHQPKVVVLMMGEPNWWNRRLMPGRAWGWLEDLVSHVRVVRWLLISFRAREDTMDWRVHYSPHFLATPLSETPTLAMRWVGVLSKDGDLEKLTPPGRLTIIHSLEEWTKDPRSGNAYAAKVALVRLLWKVGRKEDALKLAGELASSAPYLLKLHLWAMQNEKDGTLLLADRLKKREAKSEPAPLRELISADPGNPAYYEQLSKLPVEEAIDLTREMLRENPFYENGDMPRAEKHGYLSPEKFYDLLAEAIPPSFDPKAGKFALPYLRTGFPKASDLEAWARSDIEKAIELVRASGASPLLQTYPPERWVGRERPIDRVIREVAAAMEVPLSDTAAALREIFTREKQEDYYGTPGLPFRDDHLNDQGNEFVARLLQRDLSRFDLVDK